MNIMLESIGFYTLCDHRAANVCETSPLWRCEMILTDSCNFKCEYCRKLREEISGNITREMAHKTLDLWVRNGLKNVRFSGGEPMLRFDLLIELVEKCKRSGVERIAISTNGSFETSKYIQLYNAGVNDFSISFDSCCSDTVSKISKCDTKSFNKIVENLEVLSELTYVTVGVVFNNSNIDMALETVVKAHELGVADIRVIPAAQFGVELTDKLQNLPEQLVDMHPILKYRIENMKRGDSVRGIDGNVETSSNKCYLTLDDMIVAGKYHFPCVIYMREGGDPIGEVNDNVREDRKTWMLKHDCFKDPICKNMCLDVCRDYNCKVRSLNTVIGNYIL